MTATNASACCARQHPPERSLANSTPIAASPAATLGRSHADELALARGSSMTIRTRYGRDREQVSDLALPHVPRALRDSGVPLRNLPQRCSTSGADAFQRHTRASRSSSCSAATRVSARAFRVRQRPSASAAEIAGSARSAFAVRTLSRAADNDTPQLHTHSRRSSRSPTSPAVALVERAHEQETLIRLAVHSALVLRNGTAELVDGDRQGAKGTAPRAKDAVNEASPGWWIRY